MSVESGEEGQNDDDGHYPDAWRRRTYLNYPI